MEKYSHISFFIFQINLYLYYKQTRLSESTFHFLINYFYGFKIW
ncbi:hypothetical protein HMPREF9018_0297 [Prevotella amnii CRIS 21A-A]|uniref:Uncharacterized protein n=1 Tax=Prevotella amnii CRIS 21A-A TaxID=679191 RepID=E1GW85_9BACT|nr:hypothetical protein HMPREF9018_0297 [Prevotella amnii CRIS 21A-A]